MEKRKSEGKGEAKGGKQTHRRSQERKREKVLLSQPCLSCWLFFPTSPFPPWASPHGFSDAVVPPSQATQFPLLRAGRVWLLPIRSPLSA